MSKTDDLNRVLDIALSGETKLVRLAELTGYNPFSFYEGADLVGLDISGQDLTGLNFNSANLTGTDLNNIKFSPGAFNGAKLDDQFTLLQDRFEYTLKEASSGLIQRIHFYPRFRDGALDLIARSLRVTYDYLAVSCGISPGTLRNARRGKYVTMDTVRSIHEGIGDLTKLKAHIRPAEASSYMQPILGFTYITPDGNRRDLTRIEVSWLLDIARRLDRASNRYSRDIGYLWRDSPHILAWLAVYNDLFEPGDEQIEAFAMDIRGVQYISPEDLEEVFQPKADA
jgi:hypothetical protein